MLSGEIALRNNHYYYYCYISVTKRYFKRTFDKFCHVCIKLIFLSISMNYELQFSDTRTKYCFYLV